MVGEYGEPWKSYPNPMRSDGVFIGEDKPDEEYPVVKNVHGGRIPMAIPTSAWRIGMQVEPRRGQRIVACVNALDGIANVGAVGEVVAAARSALGLLNEMHFATQGHSFNKCVFRTDFCYASDGLRAALAALDAPAEVEG